MSNNTWALCCPFSPKLRVHIFKSFTNPLHMRKKESIQSYSSTLNFSLSRSSRWVDLHRGFFKSPLHQLLSLYPTKTNFKDVIFDTSECQNWRPTKSWHACLIEKIKFDWYKWMIYSTVKITNHTSNQEQCTNCTLNIEQVTAQGPKQN